MAVHPDFRHDKDEDMFTVGCGIGPVGRWMRLLLGIQLVTYLLLKYFYFNPAPQEGIASFALKIGGYTVLIAAIYLVVFYLIGELVLSKMNPWAGTIVFLGTPAVLELLGLLTHPMVIAFALYVGVSLILIFFMRYGGCEVVALPSLIFKRRFTMYCEYNVIDAVERALTPDESTARHRLLSRISMAIIIFVGGYFFLVEEGIFSEIGITIDIDKRWSLLLLIPLFHLIALTARHYRSDRSVMAPQVRKFGLGAATLAIAMVAFLSDASTEIWNAAMVLGGLVVLTQIGAILFRRLIPRVRSRIRSGQV